MPQLYLTEIQTALPIHDPYVPYRRQPWTVKDMNFFGSGPGRNVGNFTQLSAKFKAQDVFGTFNVGNGQYGCNTIAWDPTNQITGQRLDTTTRFREFGTNYLDIKANTIADDPSASIVYGGGGPYQYYNTNGYCGSITHKFEFPVNYLDWKTRNSDILWEWRFRYLYPLKPGFWLAFWMSGSPWDRGPELDCIEGFSAYEGYQRGAWQSNPINPDDGSLRIAGTKYNYGAPDFNWGAAKKQAGFADNDSQFLDVVDVDMAVYWDRRGAYKVWFNSQVCQEGWMMWKVPQGGSAGVVPKCGFMIDGSAGHQVVNDYVNMGGIPAASLPFVLRVYHSNIFERF